MNSLQSAGDGSAALSRGPSLRGDPPGLRLGLDDGVKGSLYRDLGVDRDRHKPRRLNREFLSGDRKYLQHLSITSIDCINRLYLY